MVNRRKYTVDYSSHASHIILNSFGGVIVAILFANVCVESCVTVAQYSFVCAQFRSVKQDQLCARVL